MDTLLTHGAALLIGAVGTALIYHNNNKLLSAKIDALSAKLDAVATAAKSAASTVAAAAKI